MVPNSAIWNLQYYVCYRFLLPTFFSNKLDLVFYIIHKLMNYLHHLKRLLKSSIYIHIYNYKKVKPVKNIWIDKQS